MTDSFDDALSFLKDLIQGRQHHRILRLSFPNNDGPSSQLLVNRLDAVESISRDFEYKVELLSDNAHIALKDLQGKMICVSMVRGDGSLRHFTGFVFAFRLVKTDGNVVTYEAVLGPWLRYLTLRKDSFIYHDKTLRQQTETIFADYDPEADWDWRVTGEDVEMKDIVQYNESDHNFLHRHWEERGLLYWYEHTETGHKLIITDDSTQAAPIDGSPEIRFQHHGGSVEEQGIHTWQPTRKLVQSSVALSSFDFKAPRPVQVEIPTVNEQGNVLPIESYEYVEAYGFKNASDGNKLAKLRMEEIEGQAKYIESEGNNPFAQPGRSFRLADHYDNPFSSAPSENEYLILEVKHSVGNNYLKSDNPIVYTNEMRCTRKTVPWRPGRSFNSVDTKIYGMQTARVVGPQGKGSIHTDEYGRICVQYHWDREGDFDERSSTWIRVASMWAGAELGFIPIPRVGMEVVVACFGGVPDRPIVMNCLFNADMMPPWQLPDQHALTGIRTRGLTPEGGNEAGGDSNHLLFDDTNGQMQVQLKSDAYETFLAMGNITRVEDNAGRKDAMGWGSYLFTEAWGVIRAGLGMLITTESRPGASGKAKDMSETVQRLTAARDQHEVLAELAQQHSAQENGQQSSVAQEIKAQNDAIKGDVVSKDNPFPELSTPQLVLASPSGIDTTTAKSTHIASGEHTALTTGKSLSIAAGDSVYASIRKTFRLFVHKAGMKMIAGAGNIDMEALSNGINILAKLNITMSGDNVDINAKGTVSINGGGSYTKWTASGIEGGTNGGFVIHAATHSFPGAGGASAEGANLANYVDAVDPANGNFNEAFVVRDEKTNEPMAHVRYRIESSCGAKVEGVTDFAGRTQRVYTQKQETLKIFLMDH